MTTTENTDIRKYGWVSTLPSSWQPYALLMRLDRPIGTWLLLLPCWWSVILASGGLMGLTGSQAWLLIILFGLGAVIMRGAGCVVNDLWDMRLDQKVERTRDRPLASGAVKPFQAVLLVITLALMGLTILVQFPLNAILLGFCTIPLIVTYPLMKRITYWPQLFLGLTFNSGAIIGWAAVTGGLAWPALVLYAAGIFWTLGYDTIYACMDREDDSFVGIKSTALRFGKNVKLWVLGFYKVSFLIFFGALVVVDALLYAYIVMALTMVLAFYQIRCWDTDDMHDSLRLLKKQRDIGLLICLSLILSSL